MRTSQAVLRWIVGAGVTILCAGKVFAGEPVAGVDVGVAIPVSDFRRLADPGAAVAPFVGYRWGDNVALSFLVQPQFAMFATDDDVSKHDDDLTSIFSLTAGPRFSVGNEYTELFLSVQGGIYTPTSGPLNKSAEGFNLALGSTLKLTEEASAGVYIRRDEPILELSDGNNVQFLVAGLAFQYRFLPEAPAPAPVAPVAVVPPPPAVKQKIVLRGVNFDTNKATIRPDAEPILDAAAKSLSENTAIQVSVEGHTDSRGSDAHNQKLSNARAEAVAAYLASKGVDKARLKAVGLGESQPVAGNDSAEGMAQNRRVELRVTAGE